MLARMLPYALLTVASAMGFAGSTPPPAHLDESLAKATAAGIYQVTLEPPGNPPAINQIHSWTVRISDPAGNPVSHAAIAIGGGMPQHGHGLPTKPRITRELDSGTYVLEGMKFSMPGWWQITLRVQATEGTDTVTFNTVIPPFRKS